MIKFVKRRELLVWLIRHRDYRCSKPRVTRPCVEVKIASLWLLFNNYKCFPYFVSFFLSPTSFYLLIVCAEGYCCTQSHSVTHTHTHTHGRTSLDEPLDIDVPGEGRLPVRRHDSILYAYLAFLYEPWIRIAHPRLICLCCWTSGGARIEMDWLNDPSSSCDLFWFGWSWNSNREAGDFK